MNALLDNPIFALAAEAVNFTGCTIFLTGKAGTGKTTFLKHIRNYSSKNNVVVAPTGIAAINAGGVTMHSFFQLPFIPYLPDKKHTHDNMESVDKYTLIKNIRFSNEKIELLQSLDLLIIDEVSMLRADMLDAMDEILRHYRERSRLPFGGVQVLFIGDLFQLPPVVTSQEWDLMKEQYESPFFFSSRVLQQNPILHIELKKIYRQSDEQFINLLNKIRNNDMQVADYHLLNERFTVATSDKKYDCITLTTHNYMADAINQRELKKLQGKIHVFKGELAGNFLEKSLPTEQELHLKEGAHIMFVKNDYSPAKRYFNGKLAVIKKINEEGIRIEFLENSNEFLLEKEKWKNVRFVLNKETGRVEEEELGSFIQYPIRLAWAITIHKSQGLTFEKAMIDAGASFSAGQVYVALSRCKTLQGMHLLSPISPDSIKSDKRIVAFAKRESSMEEIATIVSQEKPKYMAQLLLTVFDWTKMTKALEAFLQITKSKKFEGVAQALSIVNNMVIKAEEQHHVAEKFVTELKKRIYEITPDASWMQYKITGAKKYFSGKIKEELILPINGLQSYLQGKAKAKKYARQVDELEEVLWRKLNEVQRVTFGVLTFDIAQIERKDILEKVLITTKWVKPKKGDSKLETLAYYKKGIPVSAIAKQRALSINTIEVHLTAFIQSGEVNVFDFVQKEELENIQNAVAKVGSERLTPLIEELGVAFSYTKLRMALEYLKK